MHERRNPLVKEHFLEGNRQKWCLFFSFVGLAILAMQSYGILKTPEPYLQYFLSIGVTFILGASATSIMTSWKTAHSSNSDNSSSTNNINSTESTENRHSERIEHVHVIEEGVNANGRKPYSNDATQEE